MKKIITGGFVLGLLLMATPLVFAESEAPAEVVEAEFTTKVSLDENENALLATIELLQKQIGELQEKINILLKQVGTDPVVSVGGGGTCRVITHTLTVGQSDATTEGEVTALQEVLRAEGEFSLAPTGFFGELTEAAVQRVQAKKGIVSSGDALTTGFGVVGPRTRQVLCKKGSHYMQILAPKAGSSFAIGDKTTIVWNTEHGLPTVMFRDPETPVSNTDESQPLYDEGVTISAISASFPCTDKEPCPLSFAPLISYTIAENEANDGSFVWEVGEGSGADMLPGYYTIRIEDTRTGVSDTTDGTIKIYTDDGSSNGSVPVIKEVSGPTQLAIGDTGTWKIAADDEDNDVLSYKVTWGDENNHAFVTGVASSDSVLEPFEQTTTFTHQYADGGVYEVEFTVTDTDGNMAKTSMTVLVTQDKIVCPFLPDIAIDVMAGCEVVDVHDSNGCLVDYKVVCEEDLPTLTTAGA